MPERTSAQPMARRASRRSGEFLGTRDSCRHSERNREVLRPGRGFHEQNSAPLTETLSHKR